MGPRTRSVRPRDVLPLPSRDRPPPPPPAPARRPRLGGWLLGLLAGAVLLALLADDPDRGAPPQLVTDPATEDAVVAVLELYAAEVAVAQAAAGS